MRQIDRFTVSSADASYMRHIALNLSNVIGNSHVIAYALEALDTAKHRVPQHVVHFLKSAFFKEHPGAVVLSLNMTTLSDIEPTPAHWLHTNCSHETLVQDLVLLLIASTLGYPFSWATQQNGNLVHNVVPIRGHDSLQLGSGSLTELSWHTEDAFHPARPDALLLLCLRNDDGVPTTVCSVDYLDLPGDLQSTLREDRFFIYPDLSHTPAFNALEYTSPNIFEDIHSLQNKPERIPILSGPIDHPYIRIDPDFMRVADPLDSVATEALGNLKDLINRRVIEVVLKPGDILVINNQRAVHGRRSFTAKHDGKDRWLKRVLISRQQRSS